MFLVSDIKQTRVYQEAKQEGEDKKVRKTYCCVNYPRDLGN